MRITMFEVDGHKFNTFKEANEYRSNPENNLDPEIQINTLLYEDEDKREKGIESIDFSECGTDWETSEWMLWYSQGIYKGQIGDGIYAQECDDEISDEIYETKEVLE